MTGIRPILYVFIFLQAPPAWGRMILDVGRTVGSDDYAETHWRLGYDVRPKSRKSPGPPVTYFRAAFDRSRSTISGGEASATNALSADVEIRKDLAAGLSHWWTPEPASPAVGSYRADGADLALTARWRGLVPGRDRSDWDSEASAQFSWATHEQFNSQTVAVTPARTRTVTWWETMRESAAGLSYTGTFRLDTWLGAEVRDRRYRRVEARVPFRALRAVQAAGSVELLDGFPDFSFGVFAGRALGSRADLSGSWTRTAYVVGRADRSDLASLTLALYPAKFLVLKVSHRVSRPQGLSASRYTGLTLGLRR